MTLYLNCSDNPISFNKKNYLLRAASRLGLTNVKDIADRGSEPPTHVLNIQPCEPANGIQWTGIWHIDVFLNSAYGSQLGAFDTAFVASNQGLIHHPKERLLFQACDPSLHRRLDDVKQEYDYVLCGSMDMPMHKGRIDAHDLLKQKFTYLDAGKNLVPVNYVREYNKAKVQWVYPCDSDSPDKHGMAAQRFFECLAIGPVLAKWTDDLPLTGLVEGQDYYAFKTPEEMMDKMQFLLDHPEERERIFTNGRHKALLYHTYEHRLMSILQEIYECSAFPPSAETIRHV